MPAWAVPPRAVCACLPQRQEANWDKRGVLLWVQATLNWLVEDLSLELTEGPSGHGAVAPFLKKVCGGIVPQPVV